jgi:hypothetical protein
VSYDYEKTASNDPTRDWQTRSLSQARNWTDTRKVCRPVGRYFPTINRWENNRAKPSPLAVEKIEQMVRGLGDRGEELLAKHFSES